MSDTKQFNMRWDLLHKAWCKACPTASAEDWARFATDFAERMIDADRQELARKTGGAIGTCRDCRFLGHADSGTVCQRMPPKLWPSKYDQWQPISRFPAVLATDWCGEWRAVVTESER